MWWLHEAELVDKSDLGQWIQDANMFQQHIAPHVQRFMAAGLQH